MNTLSKSRENYDFIKILKEYDDIIKLEYTHKTGDKIVFDVFKHVKTYRVKENGKYITKVDKHYDRQVNLLWTSTRGV
ncbi:hypothetical protein [Dethiothermospora halolimnae]|uniref:hypothetical protein n=1 Tax=Dethiothermospora halolimnae TaxID=3114390 RepID=UPI003CCBEAC1